MDALPTEETDQACADATVPGALVKFIGILTVFTFFWERGPGAVLPS